MKRLGPAVFISLLPSISFAEESRFYPTFALGFSYPFAASIGTGLSIAAKKQDSMFPVLDSPALRFDSQVGIGGGLVGAGFSAPITPFVSLTVEAAMLRTWFLNWEHSNETYRGVLGEITLASHLPLKAGVGMFENTKVDEDKMTYVFVGLGW